MTATSTCVLLVTRVSEIGSADSRFGLTAWRAREGR